MAVHAEQNALLQCFRLDLARIMYVSNFPCFVCAKMIANTPIKKIIYREPYADTDGTQLLINVGIDLIHVYRK